MSNHMQVGRTNRGAQPCELLINKKKKHKLLRPQLSAFSCQCLAARMRVCMDGRVREVNEAGLSCNNSDDHQRTRAHLRARDQRVKW